MLGKVDRKITVVKASSGGRGSCSSRRAVGVSKEHKTRDVITYDPPTTDITSGGTTYEVMFTSYGFHFFARSRL
jgi:hypothetical protein